MFRLYFFCFVSISYVKTAVSVVCLNWSQVGCYLGGKSFLLTGSEIESCVLCQNSSHDRIENGPLAQGRLWLAAGVGRRAVLLVSLVVLVTSALRGEATRQT